jgi:hypothetical protein
MIGKRNNIRRCGSRDELNKRLENIIPLLKNHLLQPGLERRSLSGRDEILGGRLDAPPVAGLRRRHGPLGGSRRGAPNANDASATSAQHFGRRWVWKFDRIAHYETGGGCQGILWSLRK